MKRCAVEQSSAYAACEEMIMMVGSVSVVCPKPRRVSLFDNDHIPPLRWQLQYVLPPFFFFSVKFSVSPAKIGLIDFSFLVCQTTVTMIPRRDRIFLTSFSPRYCSVLLVFSGLFLRRCFYSHTDSSSHYRDPKVPATRWLHLRHISVGHRRAELRIP